MQKISISESTESTKYEKWGILFTVFFKSSKFIDVKFFFQYVWIHDGVLRYWYREWRKKMQTDFASSKAQKMQLLSFFETSRPCRIKRSAGDLWNLVQRTIFYFEASSKILYSMER